jgi:hypothetical protein
MSGFFQNFAKDVAGGFFGNDYVRDYTHAAKTFRPNAFQYAPKFKFLFHVYFEINPAAYAVGLPQGVNFGLAVKTVKLPSYSFDTHIMNQYNRKRIIQTKIKYDPIDIAFHDDNGNSIRNMWYNYYTYYYKDANKPVITPSGRQTITGNTQSANGGADYNSRNLYNNSIAGDEDWGYIGDTANASQTTLNATMGVGKIPFFKNIQIYGFNQHNFVLYTLVNPLITRFSHDTYDYSTGNGTMTNTMSVDYETVKYAEGALDGRAPSNTVPGFGLDANYDRTLSPIARLGSNATILGQGGLVDSVGGAMEDLANGNILGAIRTAGTAYNTFKNTNIKQVAKSDINGILNQAAQQALPGSVRTTTYYPGFSVSPAGIASAGSPTPNVLAFPQQIGPRNAGQVTGRILGGASVTGIGGG